MIRTALARFRKPRTELVVSDLDRATPELARDLDGLVARGRRSRQSVVDPSSPVVLSMTTHGPRVDGVHVTIESIARGTVLPGRFILWLDDPARYAKLPKGLRRLQRRGLEIHLVPSYGVHTKFYPYFVEAGDGPLDAPLVTADDDLVYPSNWLERLLEAWRRAPEDHVAYRVRKVVTTGASGGVAIAPYTGWPLVEHDRATHAGLATGVSGQVIPPELQRIARERGEEFRQKARTNDDIWLHWLGTAYGIRTRQVDPTAVLFPFVPGTQAVGLYLTNDHGGANDAIIAGLYGPEEIRTIAADQ